MTVKVTLPKWEGDVVRDVVEVTRMICPKARIFYRTGEAHIEGASPLLAQFLRERYRTEVRRG